MNTIERYAGHCEVECNRRLAVTRNVIKVIHQEIEEPPDKKALLLEQIALSLAVIADNTSECVGQGGWNCYTGSYY